MKAAIVVFLFLAACVGQVPSVTPCRVCAWGMRYAGGVISNRSPVWCPGDVVDGACMVRGWACAPECLPPGTDYCQLPGTCGD